MKKIKQNRLEGLNRLLELRKETNPYDSDKYAEIENNINYTINSILRDNAGGIAKLAYNKQLSDTYRGIVYIDLDTGELVGKSLTTGTRIESEKYYRIYELHNNWIANSNWRYFDILTNEEWELLREKFGDDGNYLDKQQLESIGINLDKRLIEFLEFNITEGEC